ncbi:MAG: hypothetical protein BWX59_01894 [Bacteroidetes bacterium ADurb.Bin028]|nr:MAG: hypothetical protein BWX59_01894 [Bacteroidetes bacterium ADurb.Bin028]
MNVKLIIWTFYLQINNKSFLNELLFALITAIFVAVVFYGYAHLLKKIKLRKFYGYWSVLKYNVDDYNYDATKLFVKLSRCDSSSMKISYEDISSFNIIEGKLYFDMQNCNRGTFVYGYKVLTQTEGFFPISTSQFFIDEKDLASKKKTVIRIFNVKGDETEIWTKPKNQKAFIKEIHSEQNKYLYWCNDADDIIDEKQ